MADGTMNWGALGLGALASVPSYVMAYKQQQDLDRLRKEGFKPNVRPDVDSAVQMAQNRAGNAQVAGYGQALDQINRQQAGTLGEVKRSGVSSSNVLNALARLNQQGLASRRNLAIEGSRAQQARQGDLSNLLLRRGGLVDQDRSQYERAVGALKGGIAQNIQAGTQGVLQAGLYGMRYGQPNSPYTAPSGEYGYQELEGGGVQETMPGKTFNWR